jgi:tetratricopeptide (TPR) repeat protein
MLARSTSAAGAWAALLALAVQNLGDLGTEIPGLVLAGVVCGAIVVAGTPGHATRSRIAQWSGSPRAVALVAASAAAAGMMLGATALSRGLHDDQTLLHAAAIDGHESLAEMHASARAAMRRHPAEPYLPFSVAMRAARERDESVVPWVGATIERAAVYGPAHFLLARWVAPRSPSQARLEYRLGLEQSPEGLGFVAEAARHVRGYDDAREVVPSTGRRLGSEVMDLLARELADRLPGTSARLDAQLAQDAPRLAGPILRLGAHAADDLEAGEAAPWCEGALRPECVRTALAWAQRLEQIAPNQSDGVILQARVRACDDVAGALRELEQACGAVVDRPHCMEAVVKMAISARDEAAVDQAVNDIANAGCSEAADCAADLQLAAGVEVNRGNHAKALALYKKALGRTPDDEALLERVASLAATVGLHGEAARYYDELGHKHPDDPRWAKAAAQERQAAIKEAVRL